MAVFYLLGVQVQENGILNYSEQEGNTPRVVSVLLTSAFLLMGIYGSQLNHIVGVRNDSYRKHSCLCIDCVNQYES